jgi:hypothetical protein
LSQRLLFDVLWIATLALDGVYGLVGLFLSGALLWQARRAHWRPARVVLAGMPFAVLALLFAVGGYLERAGDSLLFGYRYNRDRPTYDRVVAGLTSGAVRDSTAAAALGIRFYVDSGPPLRVAFPLPGGIIDNWEGVVWDPSGDVVAAQGFTRAGGFTAPSELQRLFGGDLVGCRVVRHPYYRCWFT